MKEITIDELIKRNTDYSKQPYTLSLVQPDKGIKFDDWDDKKLTMYDTYDGTTQNYYTTTAIKSDGNDHCTTINAIKFTE